MKTYYPYCNRIGLYVKGRVSQEDAARQEQTAKEILRRLHSQPGVILADEVGMGKTFVALAVAVSVALSNKERRPVVAMVPASLRQKWPTDWSFFREKCLPPEISNQLQHGQAESLTDLLKMLDDPLKRRKSLIFLTHGALNRGLSDKWVQLAIVWHAMRRRHGVQGFRGKLVRDIGDVLQGEFGRYPESFYDDLLQSDPRSWRKVKQRYGIYDTHERDKGLADDDPVPQLVLKSLGKLDTSRVWQALQDLPKRRTDTFEERLDEARTELKKEVRCLWKECLSHLSFRLPLLILDEAHHLKNPATRLASLFQDKEAEQDGKEVAGVLNGVFQRMLFLTATPFQLGHEELCSVLDRIGNVCWSGGRAPDCGRDGFRQRLADLRNALDRAQSAALTLERCWGKLDSRDLRVDGKAYPDVESWWPIAQEREEGLSPAASGAVRQYKVALREMKEAEVLLQPWVIRHLKPEKLPEPYSHVPRRKRLAGCGACGDNETQDAFTGGIAVEGHSLLPFLLAMRSVAINPDRRAVFAEGLASSYEAFLDTSRQRRSAGTGVMDTDSDTEDAEDLAGSASERVTAKWHLEQLERIVPRKDAFSKTLHPKVADTVERVMQLWERGEKVAVFCHYIATGRVLRRLISHRMRDRIMTIAAKKLRQDRRSAMDALERIRRRFDDPAAPIRHACDKAVGEILKDYSSLIKHKDRLVDSVRALIKSHSFLVRYFPFRNKNLGKEDMSRALQQLDASNWSLRDRLRHFFKFCVETCGESERDEYVEYIHDLTRIGRLQQSKNEKAFTEMGIRRDELQQEDAVKLLPNIRLVNGQVSPDTRRRLMLGFNTPFFPEVLITSNVLAEGIDLHLNCRHVIHHDLCWSPSTLEQRNGRLDRIGAKAERCGHSIEIFLPYVSETQDEKMYRVVMDRERWFQVVMGGRFNLDARTTEELASRVPFPARAAAELGFRLECSACPAHQSKASRE
jgi:hypothetical protein